MAELPDPSAMERREQKQQTSIDHSTSITLPSFPVPHPHHHHHLPCQPTTTTILQVLDHPHSKLGVGGQAPTPPARLAVGWPKPHNQAKTRVWARATSRRKHNTHRDNKLDNPAAPFCHAVTPSTHSTATRSELSFCERLRRRSGGLLRSRREARRVRSVACLIQCPPLRLHQPLGRPFRGSPMPT